MPGYDAAVLHKFQYIKTACPQDAPHPWTIYGNYQVIDLF